MKAARGPLTTVPVLCAVLLVFAGAVVLMPLSVSADPGDLCSVNADCTWSEPAMNDPCAPLYCNIDECDTGGNPCPAPADECYLVNCWPNIAQGTYRCEEVWNEGYCCSTNADCADDSLCTIDPACDGAHCGDVVDVDCDDADACTSDYCDAAEGCWYHTIFEGCVPCSVNADCDDGDVCNTDTCVDGVCEFAVKNNEAPCTDVSGSWQVTSGPCEGSNGFESVATMFLHFTQAPDGSIETELDPFCGSLATQGNMGKFENCAMDPAPTIGGISGGVVSLPDTGCVDFSTDCQYPIDEVCSIGGVYFPLKSVEAPERYVWSAIDGDGDGLADRLYSAPQNPLCAGMVGYAEDGRVCSDYLLNPGSACYTLLRNEVPTGSNVTVRPFEGASVTFEQVDVAGIAGVIAVNEAEGTTPDEFDTFVPIYYDVITNATISGNITTCIPYADEDDDNVVDGTLVNELGVKLLHEEGGVFVDRTFSVNGEENYVCARTTSLSQHIIASPANLCGNGLLDGLENCDDGNTDVGDGCGSDCLVEGCYVCTGQPSNCVIAARTACTQPSEETADDKATKSKLSLTDSDKAGKDKIDWKWDKGQVGQGNLGNPVTTNAVTLCIYDGAGKNFVMKADAPPSGQCGDKACWKYGGNRDDTIKGVDYKDKDLTPGGVKAIKIKNNKKSDRDGKIKFQGKGDNLGMPSPLSLDLPVTAQLHVSNGACWEYQYTADMVKKNEGGKFKANGPPK